jgi:hypothetical protein
MKCKFIVPVMHADLVGHCLERYDLDPAALLLVDNSPDGCCREHEARGFRVAYHPHNLGVAASWNLGVRGLVRGELLWIISQSVFFPQGWNVLEQAAEQASEWGINTYHGWKLVGLTKRSFGLIGEFDENYYPAYFEELDWCRRRDLWNTQSSERMTYPHNFLLAGTWGNNIAIHRQMAGQVPWDPQHHGRAYYIAKWGGDGGHERYSVPFGGDIPHDIPPRAGALCIPGVCS